MYRYQPVLLDDHSSAFIHRTQCRIRETDLRFYPPLPANPAATARPDLGSTCAKNP
jgi:hypothetical protein